eukprot:m.1323399 g.1323399  ORF g.1323399 m.1323399 type:complete len:648 (-) comp24849_c0_seq9:2839-4782(-)
MEFLDGESIKLQDSNMQYLPAKSEPIPGTMTITNYRCIFQDENANFLVDVALGGLHKIEKFGGASSSGENSYGIDLTRKDLCKFRFIYPQRNHGRRPVFDKLHELAFPLSKGNTMFAFHHRKGQKDAFPGTTPEKSGWDLYNFEKEMHRIGVPDKNSDWRVCDLNKSYELSATYPSRFAVPAALTDENIRQVAAFRSKGRMPALSWVHPRNKASLTRSAQPRVGITGKRSKEDEGYISQLKKITFSQANVQIADARPRRNAVANQAKGLGYEYASSYPDAVVSFLNIHNIHAMRESFKKLKDLCCSFTESTKAKTDQQRRWHSGVEATGWLKHVQAVLHGAVRVAQWIDNGTSVLVHCSDGWDRTAQLTGLAMLLLDPYYRTLVGFMVLIEKEWLSFGHKFQQRLGHGSDNSGDEQRSPIFVQFLECVWQILQQQPCAFEFTEALLLEIIDQLYDCRFGTFLFNCERERVDAEVQLKTLSLWDYIGSNLSKYRNPLYMVDHRTLLPFVPSIRALNVWTSFFLRLPPRNQLHQRAAAVDAQNRELAAECDALDALLIAHRSQPGAAPTTNGDTTTHDETTSKDETPTNDDTTTNDNITTDVVDRCTSERDSEGGDVVAAPTQRPVSVAQSERELMAAYLNDASDSEEL